MTADPPDWYRLAHVEHRFAVGLTLLAGAWGCPEAPHPSEPAPSARRTEVLPEPRAEGPLARVNGVPISRERFERELAQSRSRYEQAGRTVQPALIENLRSALVRRLIEAEVVRQKAQEWGLAPSPEEIESMWVAHRERFGTSDAFRAFLERVGTTEADLRNQFVDELLRDRVRSRLNERLELEDGAARRFYERHPERFQHPEETRVAQILVRVPPGADEEQRVELRARARRILERLRDGADFAALASAESDGPARLRGGDLGYLPRGRLVPPVDDVAFSLKPGRISDVIDSRFGHHIIRVMDRREARTEPFDEARPEIEAMLRAQLSRRQMREQIEAWKRQMEIEVFEPTELAAPGPGIRPPETVDGPPRRLPKPPPMNPEDIHPGLTPRAPEPRPGVDEPQD